MLGGCSAPAPTPTPTPTGFANEAEAFAAAEETYRAYVDALNSRRQNQATNPAPEDFLTDAALESDTIAQEELEASGLSIVGESRIERLLPGDRSADYTTSISILVCLDSSATRIVDSVGTDQTPPDRATISVLEVQLKYVRAAWLIAQSELTAEGQC